MKSKTRKIKNKKIVKCGISRKCSKCKMFGIPRGCAACGGPYPLCKDGCPVFDD